VQSERFLKRYLEYARTAVAPAVSRRAGETLAAEYVSLREEVRPAGGGRPLLSPTTSAGRPLKIPARLPACQPLPEPAVRQY
jgi:MCM AAA-lid domain